MDTIDRDSPIPIYYQLKNIIRAQIERGMLKPGDQLPTEQELCERHGISRSPVRQALNELAYEGVIIRRPALGTFVTKQSAPKRYTGTPVHIIGTDTRWSVILRRAAAVWNHEHLDQPITLKITMVPHDTLHDQLRAAVGDGTAPDIAMLDCVWVAEFAKAGYLFPLETLDARWIEQEYTADLYPASIEANSFQEQLYGIQCEADVSLLWYRKDWFDRERLRPPQDWDELIEVASYFMRPEIIERYSTGPHPLTFPGGAVGGEATVYNLLPFIWSAGGEVFENDRVSLNSLATHEALEFLRGLVQNGISPVNVAEYTWDQVPRLFASGQCAMALGGSYEIGTINEMADWNSRESAERVGITAIPAAPGRDPAVTMGGMGCAIFRQSHYPKLALGLLQTATRPDLILDFCRLTLQQSPRPSLNRQFSSTSEPFLAKTARMLDVARARPPIPEYAKISRQLQRMFQSVLATTTEIPEIVARTSEFISVISEIPCA